jgi:hypothetical protein
MVIKCRIKLCLNYLYWLDAGLDSQKWHKAKKAKPEAAAKLRATNTETEFEKRESVFEEHRDELTAEFKYVSFVI